MSKRKIYASRETAKQAELSPRKLIRVYSMFPIDPSNCPCGKEILDWQRKLGMATNSEKQELLEKTPFVVCPRDKSNMTRYQIVCKKCKEVQGFVWATTPTLEDWCDFHYVQWTRGDFWHGCFTPHISPVNEQLCLECCCGQDTRDFRVNMSLPQKEAEEIERKNAVGRKFGQVDSKFIVQLAK